MNQVIPDFMQKYYDGSDEEGQELIKRVAAHYEREKQLFFQTTFIDKQEFQKDWNKFTRDRKELTADEAIQPLNQKFEEQVKALASEHGYVDADEQQQAENSQEKDNSTTEVEPTSREQFLQNLKSIRERGATQTHKPRH